MLAREVLDYAVEVVLTLEDLLEVDDVGVVELAHDEYLVLDERVLFCRLHYGFLLEDLDHPALVASHVAHEVEDGVEAAVDLPLCHELEAETSENAPSH